ncbi:MAG TPA: hypothetical protein EYQ20_13890 [candidate division Zixibacteria bacterium]|nr:hypothetical protein [candidate division Zixibacteria bacterium]
MHPYESEAFRNNRRDEAFIDRVNIVKVPYWLRVTEEEMIYRKRIRDSALSLIRFVVSLLMSPSPRIPRW